MAVAAARARYLGACGAPVTRTQMRHLRRRRHCTSRAFHLRSSAVAQLFPPSADVASGVFTAVTVAVGPFWIAMTIAPSSQATKRMMTSLYPYALLGLVFAYLLPSSIAVTDWFGANGILSNFSASALASALSHTESAAMEWVHLSAWDLLAARVIWADGLRNAVETRHSVTLCAVLGPIGALSHLVTRSIIAQSRGKPLLEPTVRDLWQ